MTTLQQRRRVMPVALAVCLLASACGTNPNPNTKPQTQVAEYGTKVLTAVRAGQEAVISANKTNPEIMSDATTRKVLDGIKATTDQAQRLHDALVAYDAATSIDFRNQKAIEVRALVTQVTSLVSQAFKVDVPAPLAAQLADLAVNIIAAVEAVRTQLDRLQGGT